MLNRRIAVMEASKVINEDTAGFMNKVIEILENEHVCADSERTVMFITHLALAVQRISTGKTADPMEEDSWKEIKQCPEFKRAEELCEKIVSAGSVEFHENERKYLTLHICNMLAA